MRQNLATQPPHETHDLMTRINSGFNESNDKLGLLRTSGSDHETDLGVEMAPKREELVASRNLMKLVNNDPVFSVAKRCLGAFPQMLYLLCRKAGIDRARLITAYTISLFENEHFACDQNGKYDPGLAGSRIRAMKFLKSVGYSRRPIYLKLAGPFFFQHYPEYRIHVQNGQQTA